MSRDDEYFKQYYNENKDVIKQRSKKYYEERGKLLYEKTKESRYMRAKERRHLTEDWLNSLKLGKYCVKCGENDVDCLVFHHKDPLTAEFQIIDMVNRGVSREKILVEVDKCVLVCANCHRKMKCPLVPRTV